MDDDASLARRAAAGDVGAFSALVERHERGLRNFLDRLSGGTGAGDDLAQEAFIRAWRSAQSFRGEGSYRAWLYRIGWRVFLSSRSSARPDVEFDPGTHGGSYAPEPGARIDLERGFALLPDRERAAAILCFGEGYSHSEAAAVLGLPLGTVKSLAARAKTKLMRHLEPDNG